MKRVCIVIERPDINDMERQFLQHRFNELAKFFGKGYVRWEEERR